MANGFCQAGKVTKNNRVVTSSTVFQFFQAAFNTSLRTFQSFTKSHIHFEVTWPFGSRSLGLGSGAGCSSGWGTNCRPSDSASYSKCKLSLHFCWKIFLSEFFSIQIGKDKEEVKAKSSFASSEILILRRFSTGLMLGWRLPIHCFFGEKKIWDL